MRLVKQVARLEAAGAARALEMDPAPVELCWSEHEERVDAELLEPGEYIAVDIRIDEELLGARVVTIKERVTLAPADLGFVSDAAGRRIGRVTAIDGSLISYEALPDPV